MTKCLNTQINELKIIEKQDKKRPGYDHLESPQATTGKVDVDCSTLLKHEGFEEPVKDNIGNKTKNNFKEVKVAIGKCKTNLSLTMDSKGDDTVSITKSPMSDSFTSDVIKKYVQGSKSPYTSREHITCIVNA